MPTLTRRGLIALGGTGAAGAVLAACGAEPEDRRSSDDDAELLAAAANAEASLTAAYEAAADELGGNDAAAMRRFARASSRRATEVGAAAGGSEPAGEAPSEPGLAGVVAAAQAAVATYREAAGLLSAEEDRALAMRNVVAVAAELAAARELDGEDPTPTAFVTGSDEPPFVAPDSTVSDEEDSDS